MAKAAPNDMERLGHFLTGVMKIERDFAHERKNAKSRRQQDLREWLDKFVAKGPAHENHAD